MFKNGNWQRDGFDQTRPFKKELRPWTYFHIRLDGNGLVEIVPTHIIPEPKFALRMDNPNKGETEDAQASAVVSSAVTAGEEISS